MVWLPVLAIFNVRTDVDAHGGFIDPIREPALEADLSLIHISEPTRR